MGRIMRVNPAQIVPIESNISLEKIEGMLLDYTYHKDISDSLRISPARKVGKRLIALDGHHGLVLANLLGISKYRIYVPDSKDDVMTGERFLEISTGLLGDMNYNIARYFDSAEKMAKLPSISHLRAQYEELKDLETAKRCFRLLR